MAAFQLAVGDPVHLGTDNTSAAAHELEQMPGRARGYNSDYLELCPHYDLAPLTINVDCPNEHGLWSRPNDI